jgi:AP2-associated kinase
MLEALRDVSEGLRELHSEGITHFDLKPENVVRVGGRYKLCDFGSVLTETVVFDKLSRKGKGDFLDYVDNNSTMLYSAPEMLEPKGKEVGTAADVWMLGCLAYILKFGKQPFRKERLAIVNCEANFPEEDKTTVLIRQMLAINPTLRPTAQSLEEIFKAKLRHTSR